MQGRALQIGIIGLVCFAFGCGSGFAQKKTAPTSGVVTFEGKPVSGGSVVFSPISSDPKKDPGQPASGQVDASGSFTLGTYAKGDGAALGKGRIGYLPPGPKEITPAIVTPDGSHTPAVVEESPYANLKVETVDVEIKAGSNTLDVKLIK